MSKRLIMLLLGVTAAALGTFLFFRTFEYVTEVRTGDPTGPAAYNPLYALQKLFEALDVPAHSRAYLDLDAEPLDGIATIVAFSDPATFDSRETEALLAWIEAGGHLLIAVPEGDSERPGALLEAFGVRMVSETHIDCPVVQLDVPARPVEIDLCGRRRFETANAAIELRDEHGMVFARIEQGSGALTLVSALDFLDNEGLRNASNARFAVRALEPGFGAGPALLLYSVRVESLWRQIVFGAWPALAAAAVLLVAALFAVMRRFGPLAGHALPPRRALLEHVGASARWLQRSQADDTLCVAVEHALERDLLRRRLIRPGMSKEECISLLSGICNMPETDVRQAIMPAGDGGESTRRLALLLEIRKRT